MTMAQIILVAHLLIALAIIGLIMLQQGKGSQKNRRSVNVTSSFLSQIAASMP